MIRSVWLLGAIAFIALAGTACSARKPLPIVNADSAATCLPGERGFLRLSLRGAIEQNLDWRGADLHCEGGARPSGGGVRVSFAGPTSTPSGKLRVVFGIAAPPGALASTNRATNLTVIVEGQQRLFATLGDDKCQVESLAQQPLNITAKDGGSEGVAVNAGANAGRHAYRIAARGYCLEPVATLDGSERLYINRFDFAGVADFEDGDLHTSGAHIAPSG